MNKIYANILLLLLLSLCNVVGEILVLVLFTLVTTSLFLAIKLPVVVVWGWFNGCGL